MRLPDFRLVASILAIMVAPTAAAEARDCGGPGNVCRVPGGAYYAAAPETRDPTRRHPTVLILHDAGRDPTDIIEDRDLIEQFLDRNHAVIIPFASKRKYVRITMESRRLTEGDKDPEKSDKKYVIQTESGGLRYLKHRERGWYFRNTDKRIETKADNVMGRKRTKPLGRNEYKFIQQVLRDAAWRFWISERDLIIVGLGHGGSLTWQLACRHPGLAKLFAPIDGAYWSKVPKQCQHGGHLIQTHYRDSKFWPMDGVKAGRKKFARTKLADNLDVFARSNGCNPKKAPGAFNEEGVTQELWKGCTAGTGLGLLVMDEPFEFQDWWLDHILIRGGGSQIANSNTEPERSEVPSAVPLFLRPKTTANE
jgi:predicted esterase